MARDIRLLLLTQDRRVCNAVNEALETPRREVIEVREAALLPALLDRGADLLLIDLGLPTRSLQAIAGKLAERPDLPVLVLTTGVTEVWDRLSRGSPLERAVRAPFAPDDLRVAVDDLCERGRFLQDRLVGQSPIIQSLRDQILLVAPTPMSVLITGESGTGKDVVAQTLHHYGGRDDMPFRPINCAAIPENLLENELFGHEKGAFTDARERHRGIFEQADGGTVFLDEIGEMSLSAQVRLLRVLEDRKVTRVGGDRELPVDVRVIAASNRDLRDALESGEFRRDLYYRLKVVELSLPPLRQRREDIELLLDHFVELHTQSSKTRGFAGFSHEALQVLLEYGWPGNVRELRNLVEHLVFLGPRRQVIPEDLFPHLERDVVSAHRHLPVATNKTPDQSERELIYFALLDLKREVAELRHLMESGVDASAASRRAVYPMVRTDTPVELDAMDASPLKGRIVEPAAEPAEEGVRSLKELERDAIVKALQEVRDNRRKAAELLGIGVRTLYRKLDEYGLK
ncbi:MAG: sigma-54 dependent transcriptional regulator [Candidatus Latescibacterota bacterium]|nr:sigma-54 dependent transcriptional regulator [Candidatus Latescibacterota bacterium]